MPVEATLYHSGMLTEGVHIVQLLTTHYPTVPRQDSTEEMVLGFMHSLDLVPVKYWA